MHTPNSSTHNNLTMDEWLGALRRRAPLMLRIGAASIFVTLLAACFWPATYRSSGTILIEQQEVPSELVRSTITSYADQRIQIIQQQVMTTENLFRIIQKYDLYARDRRRQTREYVLDEMRDDVEFRMISADVIDPRSGNPTKATIAFSISYASKSAEVAAKVANELVSLYLQQNIDSRKQRTADAAGFLSDEVQRLSRDIATQQAALTTFKQQHINDLPELEQTNIQLLSRGGEELREAESRVRSLDQQIVYLQAQLAQLSPNSQVYTSTGERVLSPSDRLKFARTELARVSANYAPDHPDVLRLKREIAGIEQSVGVVASAADLQRQLQDARTQLAAKRESYSTEHPDVIRLQRTIAAVEQELSAPQFKGHGAERVEAEADNPAFIQIKAQLAATTSERASLQQKIEQLTARTDEYERRLVRGPEVDRQYSVMVRDLENTQLKYREVQQKKLDADVAQNLETERKGERFTLIEPPLTPQRPDSPNRIVILVLGALLAVGGALATVLVLENRSTVVRNRRDLAQLLGVPPLAVLPWIETLADVAAQGSRRRYAWVGAAVALLMATIAVHLFYRPLDVLWMIAMRRLAG